MLKAFVRFHPIAREEFTAAQSKWCTGSTMDLRTLFRIGFIALLAGIFVLANMPGNEAPSVFSYDKFNHMLAFFVLTFAAMLAWPRTRPLVAFMTLTLYGCAIELSQWLMPLGRQADWRDLVANSLAIGMGILAGSVANRLRGRHSADQQAP